MLARRAALIGVGVTGTAAVVVWSLGRPVAAVVLTATAAVGMINAIWLEGALQRLLQPGGPRYSRGTVGLLLARWALWAVLFGVLYWFRRFVEVWAVAVGVGCFVIALASAGLGTAGDEPAER
jgi:hypothetical protein